MGLSVASMLGHSVPNNGRYLIAAVLSLGGALAFAFIGGTVMAFGARLAGGCTSGHGISGALQLSVGSWIALMCFFAGGVVTAKLMFSI